MQTEAFKAGACAEKCAVPQSGREKEIAFLWGWGSLCGTQDTIISPITHTDSRTFILLYLLFKVTHK